MKTKKIPISFNEFDLEVIGQLTDLMGIAGVYGDLPKCLKFGIRLSLSALQNPAKVYGGLSDDDLRIYFSSLHAAENQQRMARIIEKLQKTPRKV